MTTESAATVVSVIIPACHEDDTLGTLLTEVVRQVGDGEVIVVNAGSRPEISRVAERAAPGVQLVEGGPRYPGAARNAGAVRAGGDVLVFLDAGLEVGDGWLDALVAPLRDGTADVAWGETRPRAGTVLERIQAAAIWPRSGVLRVAANVAVTRTAFMTVGPFRAGIRAGEDLEWRQRVRTSGLRSVDVSGAVAVYAAFAPTVPGIARKWWLYTHHEFAGGRPSPRKLVLTAVALGAVGSALALPLWWGAGLAAAYALTPVLQPLARSRARAADAATLLRGWPLGLAARAAMDVGRSAGILSGLAARVLRR